MRLLSLLKMWFYNHFKHVKIQAGGDCSIGKLKLSVCGKNCIIRMGRNVRLENVEIKVFGNNNHIFIDSNNTINGIRIAIEDDNNFINIGSHVYIGPDSLLAALEGTQITIGKDCMIAGLCEIRTSDSHSLTNLEGSRINPAKNIEIGEHVWIGAGCMLLKGCKIPNHSIVAARSLVTSTENFESYSLWGGIPARLLKKSVNWNKER